jgi:hypothetical protein
MTGRRFDRAKTELVRSINKLTPEQKFYVFFFNEETVPLFYPKPAKGMVPASKQNVQRASSWIRKQEVKSVTDPTEALKRALEMKPEVIFFLTDGDLDNGHDNISKRVREMLIERNSTHAVIHTIGFEIEHDEDAIRTLEGIARENNGTFRLVR